MLLALSTASGHCSIALRSIDETLGIAPACWTRQTGVDQSSDLLGWMESFLSSQGVSRQAIVAIAFDAGPGAFTSLRVACSTAQGLAFGLGVPLIPISSGEALAVQAIGPALIGNYPVLVATDARMSEIYATEVLVECDGGCNPGRSRITGGPIVCSPERAPLALFENGLPGRPLALVGDAFARYPEIEAGLLKRGARVWRPSHAADPLRAETLAWMAANCFRAGQVIDASDAAPLYVRDKVALDRIEQAEARARRAGPSQAV